mmetsp:Transcript_3661/g.9295  ORF Transcript_3661/g.9295 Transcript_3661/m.9295 type:complete len:80 (-) Transcript_3661:8-247(-)
MRLHYSGNTRRPAVADWMSPEPPVTDLAGSLKLGMWMTMMLLLALGRSSCHPFQSRRAVAEDAIEVMLSSLLTVSTQSS